MLSLPVQTGALHQDRDRNKYGIKQQDREEKIYRALPLRGASTARISRYHGKIETRLGRGYVYDAVCDTDGCYASLSVKC